MPIRSQFARRPNVSVHLAHITRLSLEERWVGGEEGVRLRYDYLVLACGAQHSYFGKSEWEDFAPGLKTLEQATELRRRILSAFEQAENELDPERQRAAHLRGGGRRAHGRGDGRRHRGHQPHGAGA